MELRSIFVEGYRSIRKLRMSVGRVTVVRGANGSGKTNLYRALSLVTAAAQGRLAKTLVEEGGLPSALWAGRGELSKPIRAHLLLELEDFDYELEIGRVPPQGHEGKDEHGGDVPSKFLLDPDVKFERIRAVDGKRRPVLMERKAASAFLRDANGERVTFAAELWSAESVLSQLAEPHRFPAVSGLQRLLGAWRFYHHFDTSPRSLLRQARPGVRTPALAHDGEDLAAAIATVVDIGNATALRHHFGAAFPGSSLVESDEGIFSLKIAQPGLNRPLTADEWSDGTLRYLCLLAALLSPRPPPLLALNEPETSLHPDLMPALAELILEAAKQTQVWVTTHDQELTRRVGASRAAKTVELEKVDGETRLEGARLIEEDDEDAQ